MDSEKEHLEIERDNLLRDLEEAEGVLAFNALAASLMQSILAQAGYKVKVDGILGPKTVVTLQKFLRREGYSVIPVNGIFDLKTTHALTQWSGDLARRWKESARTHDWTDAAAKDLR